MSDYNCILREIRTSNKITQEELAEKVKVSRQTISSIENGIVPKLELAHEISKVFKLKIEDIFFKGEKEV